MLSSIQFFYFSGGWGAGDIDMACVVWSLCVGAVSHVAWIALLQAKSGLSSLLNYVRLRPYLLNRWASDLAHGCVCIGPGPWAHSGALRRGTEPWGANPP